MKKLLSTVSYTLSGILLLFLLVAVPYVSAYKGKIIPGVFFHKISLGNKSYREAVILADKYLGAYKDIPLTLDMDGKIVKVSQGEFGVYLDSEKTVKSAFEIGRRGSLFERIHESITSWYAPTQISCAYVIDGGKFTKTIEKVAENIDNPPTDAIYQWESDELVILPDSGGEKLEKEKLKNLIQTSLQNLDFKPIEVPIKRVEPDLSKRDLNILKSQVYDLITRPPTLRYESRTWTPTPERALSFLKMVKKPTSSKAEIDLVDEALGSYFNSLALQVDVAPKLGVFNFDGERITAFELGEAGKSLDVDEAALIYSDQLLSIKNSEEVELPVKMVKMAGGANDYGISTLLGEGETNFKGSSKGRMHNISLASSRLRGILVPPGEVFSLNSNLGEVTAETGYDQAYIIRDRRTILGAGGGVCQVSTTLFRAAFNAGLPMVERYAHSYRVHYYEPPMGFDATVYAPYTDLKFRNDTSNHILIYSYYDPKKYTLNFKIFGTYDGREVKIEGPIVHSQTPAPEPLYQEDSSLAPGQVKQIDFASPGAKVTVERLVVRDGETLIDENFHSNYSPWQAVYLVGPSEEE